MTYCYGVMMACIFIELFIESKQKFISNSGTQIVRTDNFRANVDIHNYRMKHQLILSHDPKIVKFAKENDLHLSPNNVGKIRKKMKEKK